MTQKQLSLRFGVLTSLVLVIALSRLLLHAPNFSPITAICLFCGASFSHHWQKYVVPLGSIWFSDLLLNNFIFSDYFPEFTWLYQGFYWQYTTYALLVIGSTIYYSKQVSKQKVVIGALSSALVFYLVSNFGVWYTGAMYTPDWKGLLACYVAGIPFFKNTVMSSVIYATVLFGGSYYIESILKTYWGKTVY